MQRVTKKMLELQVAELNAMSRKKYYVDYQNGACTLRVKWGSGGTTRVTPDLTKADVSLVIESIKMYERMEAVE